MQDANNLFLAAGDIFMYAMRFPPPQAWHPYIKGEVFKHGQLDQRAGRGQSPALYTVPVGVLTEYTEHAAQWQYGLEQGLQSSKFQASNPLGCG